MIKKWWSEFKETDLFNNLISISIYTFIFFLVIHFGIDRNDIDLTLQTEFSISFIMGFFFSLIASIYRWIKILFDPKFKEKNSNPPQDKLLKS